MWIQRDEIAKCNKPGPGHIVYANDMHSFYCGAVVPPDLTSLLSYCWMSYARDSHVVYLFVY
jgi:hypothetical protein